MLRSDLGCELNAGEWVGADIKIDALNIQTTISGDR